MLELPFAFHGYITERLLQNRARIPRGKLYVVFNPWMRPGDPATFVVYAEPHRSDSVAQNRVVFGTTVYIAPGHLPAENLVANDFFTVAQWFANVYFRGCSEVVSIVNSLFDVPDVRKDDATLLKTLEGVMNITVESMSSSARVAEMVDNIIKELGVEK